MSLRRLCSPAFAFLLLTTGCASHSSDSNASGASQSSNSNASDTSPAAAASSPPTSAPTPTPTRTPVAANAANITAAAERFIHSWDKNGYMRNLGRSKEPNPFAHSFPGLDHNIVDAFDDFWSSAGDINGTVDDARGPIADITMNYGLPYTSGASLRAVIRGTLHFVHGSSGWLIDNAHFVGRTLTALRAPNGEVANILDSKITGPEAIQFHIGDAAYEWSRMPNGSWKVAALDTPIPNAVAAATDPPAQAQPVYAPGAEPPDAGCEDVDITGVYADGEILELNDGRRLKVAPGDESTSASWTAPVDALICGDRLIDKDDNETVDLAD